MFYDIHVAFHVLFAFLSVCLFSWLFVLKLVCLRFKCFIIFRRATYCGLSKCMVKAIFRAGAGILGQTNGALAIFELAKS